MRLALFTDTYEPEINGVARTLARWIAYLEKQGVACKVFAPSTEIAVRPQPGALPYKNSNSVSRFASLPFFMYPECRMALPNPRYIRKALQDFQPTMVHVATPFNLGLCGIHYAKKLNLPLMASYHTNFDRYLPFYNLQWMEKLLWRYMNWFHQDCSQIFVPTHSVRNELIERGWQADRLSIWSRGIDTSRFHDQADVGQWKEQLGIDKDAYVVLYAGRMAPEKQVDVAVQAFNQFRQRITGKAVLVLAGDGPSAPAIKELARKEGIEARFAGFQQQEALQQYYAAADVLLFPSPTETFGNVVLEAMACGTPVICANKGGVTDTVQHGKTGFLCEAGHSSDFADALERLYADRELADSFAKEGKTYSVNQSWDAIFAQLFEYCIELSETSRPPLGHIAN
ncbi:glycosyltransferase family 1 protein [Paenibacillus protaetiae]|uniref:Glycosyltransferase family 1 protein n=2 Tax=Paenibacillus protaetiae TaxID=2509456 RepID=A0A4P6EZ80_9BACL|nr:glycosyltransferase family 1 protein [Paenibacillus protaetiae]